MGYKTYLVAILGLIYAGIGLYMGYLDWAQALQYVQISITGITLRGAINTAQTVPTITTTTVSTPINELNK